ncbi:MAG TPA: VWA domain-containing protein [Polyangiales bacterium]|nr:VWA domain-containing protein [Polyangiales bacterium]
MPKSVGYPCTLLAALVAVGCGPGLKLTRIEAASNKPSNVAVFFAVDKDEKPVADLLASDFNIYEDDKLVSVDESRQTIVNPQIAAAHFTLLLVDMSASVSASEQMHDIAAAAIQFVGQVGKQQRVALYAFDGSKNLYELSAFSPTEQQTAQGLNSLESFQSRDPSTNLNGAVVQALRELDKTLHTSSVPLRFGTLVVFTDGTDRANRVPLQEMVDAVEASPHSVYAIGVGHEIDDSTLSRIGKSGYIRVEDSSASAAAFNEIGERIVRFTQRYYLLSYCTPARAGKHKVSVEAVHDGDKGKLDYEFNADGFDAGCDPNKPPPFDTTGKNRRTRDRMLAGPGDVSAEQPSKPKPRPKAEAKTEVKAEGKAEVKTGE